MNVGVFIGLAGLDLVYFLDKLPKENGKIKTDSYSSYVGGPAANAAITYSLLGGKAILITYIGNSSVGVSLKNELQNLYGITVYDCSDENDKLPSTSCISINNNNASRTILSGQHKLIDFHIPIEVKQAYKEASFFFTDCNTPEISLPLIKSSLPFNKPVVLDLGSWKENSLEFISMADELIASSLCATDHKGVSLFELQENINTSKIAVTNGEKRIVWKENNLEGFIQPPIVNAKDTLAAGDVFHGAYCFYRFVKGFLFQDALSEASKVASESVVYKGPREGVEKYKASCLG